MAIGSFLIAIFLSPIKPKPIEKFKMKNLILLTALVLSLLCSAQTGKIYPKEKPIPGEINTFIYEPPVGLKLPEQIWAFAIAHYQIIITTPMTKKNNHYEFSLKFPDSTNYFFLDIENQKGQIYDHNNDLGYEIYLKESPKENPIQALIDKGELCWWTKMNGYRWDYEQITTDLQQVYTSNPNLKNQDSYQNYLKFAYSINSKKYKSEVIKNIDELIHKGDEESLLIVDFWYKRMKLPTKHIDTLQKQITSEFPKGTYAKREYINTFDKTPDKTEEFIMKKQNEFISFYDDNSDEYMHPFKRSLLQLYLEQNNIDKVNEIEKSIDNKRDIITLYNNTAWELCGERLDSPVANLDFAIEISKKSLDITQDIIDNPNTIYTLGYINFYYMFADTYALLLYKQGNYQKAFEYQHEIAVQDKLDKSGKERYAVYAEKVKGLEFTKAYIEKELNNDVDSKALVNQLKEINKKLNITGDKALIEQYRQKIKQNNEQEIIDKIGALKAPEFNLKNLTGKSVKLSDLKGKLVVLDFWATWCGPCKRSFPHMQELVNTYKDVEFLFIDTWERGEKQQAKEKTTEYIKSKNYSFNVLFDSDKEVADTYNIKGIPSKIVIDKEGNILSINPSSSELKVIIEENK